VVAPGCVSVEHNIMPCILEAINRTLTAAAEIFAEPVDRFGGILSSVCVCVCVCVCVLCLQVMKESSNDGGRETERQRGQRETKRGRREKKIASARHTSLSPL